MLFLTRKYLNENTFYSLAKGKPKKDVRNSVIISDPFFQVILKILVRYSMPSS